ncbi:MAG: hypothetical protein M3Z66_09805, partial [Chloroflexota bacterium]|nr:hypothetical protein [Chloroflexota bacterium]
IRMLAVKTASGHESREDDVYAATRAFYESCGFIPVMDLDIWEDDLALLLVHALPTNNMVID